MRTVNLEEGWESAHDAESKAPTQEKRKIRRRQGRSEHGDAPINRQDSP
jgi:hypothetical protein